MVIYHDVQVAYLIKDDLKPIYQKRMNEGKLRAADLTMKHFSKSIIDITKNSTVIIYNSGGTTLLLKSQY